MRGEGCLVMLRKCGTVGLTAGAAAAGLAAVAANEVNVTAGIAVDVKSRPEGAIVVDERVEKGPVKAVNGVNGCPAGEEAVAAWKAAEIPFARTHDLNLAHGYGAPYVIDVPWIFRDFDADENDPKSYDFACTDALLKRIRETGCEPFYRLGGAYESKLVKKYNIFPPKDFDKWARVCEHIVAHYNEGWADGFRWNVRYWEIWNEPDLRTGTDDGAKGAFWRGPRSEFVRLFKTALGHLKAKYPSLRFGGPAVSGVGAWDEQYLAELARERVPLDFFSWHGYGTDPRSYVASAKRVRALLDRNGYVKTESINDEWNYIKGWDTWTRAYSMEVEKGRFNQKGAAFLAAALCCWQEAPVDMTMFYDARQPGMNALFDPVTGLPMRGYYPFLVWKDLRRLGTQVEAQTKLKDVFVTAAKNEAGRLGVFIVRYTDDNNVVRPVRVTVRLASGRPLAAAKLHLTDDVRIHTATYFEANADGSVDLVLRPCSFAFLELE